MHCGDQKHAWLCLGRRPCTSRRRVQGRSQGTTLSTSDLHNARASILNPFYNMEYEIITKIEQNMTGSGHYKHKSHSQSVQWRHNHIQLSDVTIAKQRTLPWAHVNGTAIVNHCRVYYKTNDLQCQLKTAGVITNDGFLECITLYNTLCTMNAGETMHCKPCYNLC